MNSGQPFGSLGLQSVEYSWRKTVKLGVPCVCVRVCVWALLEGLDGSLIKTCHTIRGVSTLCTFLSLLILQISGGWGHGAGPPRPRRPERRKGWIYSSLHRNSRANVLMAQVSQALRLRTSRGSLSNYRSIIIGQDSLTDTHTHTHTHTRFHRSSLGESLVSCMFRRIPIE